MAFAAHGPLLDEVVGSFGPFVYGVVALSGGAATVTVPQMSTVKGCVATAETNVVNTTASGNVITFGGTGSEVVSYIAWGDLKR